MSAFRARADLFDRLTERPLIANSGHVGLGWPVQTSDDIGVRFDHAGNSDVRGLVGCVAGYCRPVAESWSERIIEDGRPVHGAAIVPEHDVAGSPLMAIGEARLCRKGPQIVEKSNALVLVHSFHDRALCSSHTNEQCPTTEFRMSSHERVCDVGEVAFFFFRERFQLRVDHIPDFDLALSPAQPIDALLGFRR